MSDTDQEIALPVYDRFTEGELLALAVSPQSLTDPARRALTAELQRRGISEADLAAHCAEAGRSQARESRWRKVRAMRLKNWIVARLLVSVAVIGPLAIGLGIGFGVDILPGLGGRARAFAAFTAMIAASVAFWAASAYVLFSRRAASWARRWLWRSWWRSSELNSVHTRYCAARNRGAAAFFLALSSLKVFYAYRDLSRAIPTGHRALSYFFVALAAATLAELFALFTCVRERLVIGFWAFDLAISVAARLIPGWVRANALPLRECTLLVALAAAAVSLSLLRSALWAPAPGAVNARSR